MTQADSRVPAAPMMPGRARNDIYTVLLIVATVLVLVATVYLAFMCYGYYGTFLPLSGE